MPVREQQTIGCLIGTAIGDALGLPYEGLRADRAAGMLGRPDRFRFLFGYGLMSDDTEHSCLVAESMIEAAGAPERFEAIFANRLKWWLLSVPAGAGLATLRACLRLTCGVSPKRSGVFSAGNGPAMRAAILGAAVEDPICLRQLVNASTRLTHTDPRAEAGAMIVAAAARISTWPERPTVEALFHYLTEMGFEFSDDANSLSELLKSVSTSVDRGESTIDFAKSLGLQGFVTGFVNHTVPVSIHAWLSHPDDWENAVQSVILCGGDADTTAAITGGIVGSRVGLQGIPHTLCAHFIDWPRSLKWLENLGHDLAIPSGNPKPHRTQTSYCALLLRNCIFVPTVLFHGFRRLLPPY